MQRGRAPTAAPSPRRRMPADRSVAPEEQVAPPGLVPLVHEVRREQGVQVAPGLERRPEQADARLFRCLAALAVVARLAGGDKVVPGVGTATMAGQDVVERQVMPHTPAVLAGVAV